MCGWQVKLCDPLVTHGPYLSALEVRHDEALYKSTFTYLPLYVYYGFEPAKALAVWHTVPYTVLLPAPMYTRSLLPLRNVYSTEYRSIGGRGDGRKYRRKSAKQDSRRRDTTF